MFIVGWPGYFVLGFFFFLLAFIPPRLPMPPCVVRPVGPPARAGEHSKPSCLQARAVRARRTDVLGVGGAPSPERPTRCLRARALSPTQLFVPGRLPTACSFILFFGRSCGPGSWMPGPAHHPSIHPSIRPFRSASHSLEPATPLSMPIAHLFMPVALSRLACIHLCHARPHAVRDSLALSL